MTRFAAAVRAGPAHQLLATDCMSVRGTWYVHCIILGILIHTPGVLIRSKHSPGPVGQARKSTFQGCLDEPNAGVKLEPNACRLH